MVEDMEIQRPGWRERGCGERDGVDDRGNDHRDWDVMSQMVRE